MASARGLTAKQQQHGPLPTFQEQQTFLQQQADAQQRVYAHQQVYPQQRAYAHEQAHAQQQTYAQKQQERTSQLTMRIEVPHLQKHPRAAGGALAPQRATQAQPTHSQQISGIIVTHEGRERCKL